MHPPAMDLPYFCFPDNNWIPEGADGKGMDSKDTNKDVQAGGIQKDDGEAKSLLLGSHSIQKYAKVAEKLCVGGACFYLSCPIYDTVMMNSFIPSHIAPNVKKILPESDCLVLGNALLWLICSPVVDDYVPTDLKDKVLADWAHVCGSSEVDTPAPAVDNQEAIRYNRCQELRRAIVEVLLLIQLAI